MGPSHKKPTLTEAAELSALVAGVAELIGTLTGDLRIAAQKMPHGPGKAAKNRGGSTNVSELQASFQALAQCALLLETETERFRRITRTSAQ